MFNAICAEAQAASASPSATSTAAEGAEVSNSHIAFTIDEYIRSERDRRILKRRLIDGICYDSLAEEFELSERQVKNIVYKGQERVFKHL